MSNDNTAKPTAGRIEQIRSSHANARPKTSNPAWQNTHADLSVVLTAYGQLSEQRDELLAALAPFAAFAKHFPAERKFGNRPTSGVIYSMASGGMPDAEFTAEQLRTAAAIIAKIEAKPRLAAP